MKRIVVAIDGPAGAGKSTIAKKVASNLGYTYIDTGAMYRALTWYVLNKNISPHNEAAVCQLTQDAVIRFTVGNEGDYIYINGINVTNKIRSESVSAQVSVIAGYACVRKRLVEQQRKMALNGGVIMDGRDIGTVVLPEADLKIYLTASVEVRAQRRAKQLEEMYSKNVPELAQIIESITARDELDKSRKESPLRQAEDAILIDNSDWTLAETIDYIETMVKRM